MSEPPREVEFLTAEDLLVVVEALMGTRLVVADFGLLESAAARPQASLYGDDAYPDLARKAAALLLSLVTNHPLVDGNKRLGLAAMVLFYAMNGIRLDSTQDQRVDLVMAVAEGSLCRVDEVAAVLRSWELEPRPVG